MNNVFADYFRCPDRFSDFEPGEALSDVAGYFTFEGAIGYGRPSAVTPAADIRATLPDVSKAVSYKGGRVRLPFDLTDVVTNLRQERYIRHSQHYLERVIAGKTPRRLYYFLRPLLSVGVRRHLQKVGLTGWEGIAFPRWPVDVSVDTLALGAMGCALKFSGLDRIPFIWFWPGAMRGSAIMTHDVEGPVGREFCTELMDLDDSVGIKSAFQVVPDGRRGTSRELPERLRSRGFEVNLHDLNHDGRLFQSRQEFLERVKAINRYARELGCHGFRSGSMYREQSWFDAFEFAYDMSVPNVAHLEPQRGGCCTVMPYFVGKILELPVTTIQDYSLFHILRDYSIDLWRRQMDLILSKNGMISIITHPDYLIETRARGVYRELLAELVLLGKERQVWITLPGEVNRWWRNRNLMSIVPEGNSWRIEGPDSHRATVAYAKLEGERVLYELDPPVRATDGRRS